MRHTLAAHCRLWLCKKKKKIIQVPNLYSCFLTAALKPELVRFFLPLCDPALRFPEPREEFWGFFFPFLQQTDLLRRQ